MTAPLEVSPAILDLSANECPLPPSEAVIEAITRELAQLTRYPDRDDPLPAAIAEYHGRGLTAGHIFTAASGSEVLELIARTYLAPGSEAIICSPTFPVYKTTSDLQRATLVDVPLEPGTFGHNVDAIVAAVTDRTRLLYVCNPGNPSGVTMSAAQVTALLDALPPLVTVVLDEVYYHFVERDDFPDSIGYVLAGRPVILVHTFSKAYGLAGMRLGYGIASPAVAAQVAAFKRVYHLARVASAAGIAALGDRDYVARLLAIVREGKQYLYRELDRLGIDFGRTETNFVLIRAPRPGLHRRLQERGIRVRPTEGNGLPGYVRVTVGLPDENRRFIEALESVLSDGS